MILPLACIVEGHGEVEALPILLRRIAGLVAPGAVLRIPHPLRVPRSRLVKRGEIERAVELAARQAGPSGSILILLDSDDDCPAELGPALLARAHAARADVEIRVALAHREFESWFVAAAESLGLERAGDPEAIRGAKEWLAARRPGKYVETLDQPALAAVMDLEQARRSRSFDRFYRQVSRLLAVQ